MVSVIFLEAVNFGLSRENLSLDDLLLSHGLELSLGVHSLSEHSECGLVTDQGGQTLRYHVQLGNNVNQIVLDTEQKLTLEIDSLDFISAFYNNIIIIDDNY